MTIFKNITEQKESFKHLKDMNSLMMGRDLKMVELKKEVENLKSQPLDKDAVISDFKKGGN